MWVGGRIWIWLGLIVLICSGGCGRFGFEALGSGGVLDDAGLASTDPSDVFADTGTSDAGPPDTSIDSSATDAAADGSSGTEGADAGPDASVDPGVDAMDAGVDASVDAGVDVAMDAGIDAGVDAAVDAGFDAGPPPKSMLYERCVVTSDCEAGLECHQEYLHCTVPNCNGDDSLCDGVNGGGCSSAPANNNCRINCGSAACPTGMTCVDYGNDSRCTFPRSGMYEQCNADSQCFAPLTCATEVNHCTVPLCDGDDSLCNSVEAFGICGPVADACLINCEPLASGGSGGVCPDPSMVCGFFGTERRCEFIGGQLYDECTSSYECDTGLHCRADYNHCSLDCNGSNAQCQSGSIPGASCSSSSDTCRIDCSGGAGCPGVMNCVMFTTTSGLDYFRCVY